MTHAPLHPAQKPAQKPDPEPVGAGQQGPEPAGAGQPGSEPTGVGQPDPEPAAPGKRERARWPWVATGVLAAIALGSAAYAMSGAGGEPPAVPPAAPTRSAAAGEPEQVISLDRTAAEGVFVVTVTGLRCGLEAVGPAELRQRAKGEFCLVEVAAENAGREARLLDGGAQRAVDTSGRAYVVADEAAALLNDGMPTLLEEIAPGRTVRGVLPFDVPAGTHLSALMVHESVGSRGARLPLA